MRRIFAIAVIGPVLAASMTYTFGASPESLPTFNANYRVEYKGDHAGTTAVALTFDQARGIYEYRSETTLKGIYKLLLPDSIRLRSEFALRNGEVVPLHFWLSDGKQPEQVVSFDWQRLVAISGDKEIAVPLGTLDPATLQAALMIDMASSSESRAYTLIDESQLATQHIEIDSDRINGALAAESWTQRREGSSRSTRIFVDPARCYLPTRIEQGDQSDVVLVLDSVVGLTTLPAACRPS